MLNSAIFALRLCFNCWALFNLLSSSIMRGFVSLMHGYMLPNYTASRGRPRIMKDTNDCTRRRHVRQLAASARGWTIIARSIIHRDEVSRLGHGCENVFSPLSPEPNGLSTLKETVAYKSWLAFCLLCECAPHEPSQLSSLLLPSSTPPCRLMRKAITSQIKKKETRMQPCFLSSLVVYNL